MGCEGASRVQCRPPGHPSTVGRLAGTSFGVAPALAGTTLPVEPARSQTVVLQAGAAAPAVVAVVASSLAHSGGQTIQDLAESGVTGLEAEADAMSLSLCDPSHNSRGRTAMAATIFCAAPRAESTASCLFSCSGPAGCSRLAPSLSQLSCCRTCTFVDSDFA